MMPIGVCASLTCLWEATAPKPGNVYRGADFDDLTFADFVTSAAVIGPVIDCAAELGVGTAIRLAVEETRNAVGTNTNLGMLLLLAPLAVVESDTSLKEGIVDVLADLTKADTQEVYTAIQLAEPGGLGTVAEADVHSPPPEISLVEAMRLAVDRDLIARQYTNGFQQVFEASEFIAAQLAGGKAVSEAIVHSFLQLLAKYSDSLIARKCGPEVAGKVSARAAAVLESADFEKEVADFDFWLRADGHRRNPGTTADLVAAGLFVLLREERLDWPVRFYPT